jgi:hypothetical protein
MTQSYNISIKNEKFGTILNETFFDGIQFKLFLKAVHASLELKLDLSFFNGDDFLFHIPFRILTDSIIITSVGKSDLTQLMRSKVEALATINKDE